MFIFENKFTLGTKTELAPYFNSYPYAGSTMCFSGLYLWRNVNNFCYQEIDDFLFIAGMDNLSDGLDRHFCIMPLTKNGEYDPLKLKNAIRGAKKIFNEKKQPFYLMLVPENMTTFINSAFDDELLWEYDRDNSDYVYKKDDLINLSGRTFHKKKNHLNYFLKTNTNWEYVPLTSSMSNLANEFIKEFNLRKNLTDPHEVRLLSHEEDAMRDIFLKIEKAELFAGAIVLDGKIEALSIGGMLNKTTAVCHIEKANVKFRGLYQLINREWCKNLPTEISFVNREEDMGIENLRKAKLSYQPDHLVNKYIVRID
jgi:hypothetical protein